MSDSSNNSGNKYYRRLLSALKEIPLNVLQRYMSRAITCLLIGRMFSFPVAILLSDMWLNRTGSASSGANT
jgi:hypothetical protein